MAKTVRPDDFVTQGRNESVIYECPWDAWEYDLKGPRTQRVMLRVIGPGTPCAVSALDDVRAVKASRILVRAGSMPSLCEVVRTVSTTTEPVEKRIRSFRILVE